jgi:hypothetical protein
MRIPFERTIAGAYRFARSNILSVIGIAWFPYLILLAAIAGAAYLFGPQMWDFIRTAQQNPGKPDPARLRMFVEMIGLIYLALIPLFIVISAMVQVGVMRKALGLHEGPEFIFFSLGSQVWRLIGGYLLLGLIAYGGAIAVALLGAFVWNLIHAAQPALATPIIVIAGIAMGLFLIYAVVRTYFFLPAVVVAENRIGLGRSWQLGGGNFWRIIGIVLVIYLPVAFAVSIVNSSIMQLTIMPVIVQHSGPHTPAEQQQALKDLLAAFVRFLPYFGVLQLAQLVLLAGLNGGAVATAYRSVSDEEKAPA